ncbi:hypothetical protein Emag_005993 [Eimeria magna]
MARGKRSFRGAELMGKRRAAKYQKAAATAIEDLSKNERGEESKEDYAELIYENAAFEEYYKLQSG